MAKRVLLQVVNVPHTININADKIEEDGQKLILSRNGEKVGEFTKGSVTGWWYIDDASVVQ